MMQWSSDVFSEAEASETLRHLMPSRATKARCSLFGKYLNEIPPPHSPDAYVSYCSQIADASERFKETNSPDAELWLYALVVRTLSFEVETDIEGPIKLLFQVSSQKQAESGEPLPDVNEA
ncbi:hypothetical protein [Sulfitobacter sp. 1A12157]|uniref:hypothetical protein n=1 Tax=Sulfitobacter sp. 1A12157 TaxID=3368594 RepID=UPI003745DBB6